MIIVYITCDGIVGSERSNDTAPRPRIYRAEKIPPSRYVEPLTTDMVTHHAREYELLMQTSRVLVYQEIQRKP